MKRIILARLCLAIVVSGIAICPLAFCQVATELKRTGTVRGRVVDRTGEPIKSASVTVVAGFSGERYGYSRRYGAANVEKAAITDETGYYEIREIASRVSHEVWATAEGYGRDRLGALVLEEGEVYNARDLVLQVADMSIEGTVRDADGIPVRG